MSDRAPILDQLRGQIARLERGSLRAHPVAFLRADLTRDGHVTCADLVRVRGGRSIDVAGLVLIRQKPGSAKGVMFITLEDETGIASLIVWPQMFERQRTLVLSAGLMSVRGRVQCQGRVIHVVAERFTDLSFWLRRIGERDEPFPLVSGRGDEAKHGGSPDHRDPLVRPSPGTGNPERSSSQEAQEERTTAPPVQVKARNFR